MIPNRTVFSSVASLAVAARSRALVPALAAAGLVMLTATGCVTTGTYNQKVAEMADHDKKSSDQIKTLESEIKDRDARIAVLTAERDKLRKQLDDTTGLAAELKARLEKLGQNVDQLTSEKGQLSSALEDLRKQKQAAEARAAVFRDLVAKLRSMIDAGQLKVIIRDGRMLIALPNDVLFDSGKTNVKTEGQAALQKVAQVLSTIKDRRFLVAGHTDDVPIHTARFPSNWELSTARAVEVTRFLVDNGMRPQTLAAAGYSEFDPVVANDSPEHRSQNRRIEIVLEPNLSDLPSLDDIQTAPKK